MRRTGPPSSGDALHAVFSAALVLASAAYFYVPALRATGGDWPAPLDDVFIHYDFARSTAMLHPFEWIAGQGYSSGETSALYPFLLAPGYLLGFRGMWLGLWAALLACAALYVTLRAVRELVAPAPEWVSWLGGVLILSVGVLDWTLFSGMEGAVFVAASSLALVLARRAREAPPTHRRAAAWRVGLAGALLVWLRPEAVVLVPLLAVIVARRCLSQPALPSLLRTTLPPAVAALALLAANRLLTGDAPSAGALAKLLSYRPFLSDGARSLAALVSLGHFVVLLFGQLGRGTAVALVYPALALVALGSRRTRAPGLVCLAGSLAWTLVVSWNDTARYQNFRSYMPAVALLLFGAVLGLRALSRSRLAIPAAALALVGAGTAATGIPAQAELFAGASSNIHDQQVEVGRRLALRMPEGASVLVGDAGAIPYVSERHAIDALGLGGYAGLPFARAAALGEGAVVELLEHVPPGQRPRFLALYPTWFGGITAAFGREVDHVSITKNFVCGGVTKGIYEADWSPLADDPGDRLDAAPSPIDVLDVADVLSERAHAYTSPEPNGGFGTFEVRREAGAPRFDAGRIIPEGREEGFSLGAGGSAPVGFLVRSDEGDARVEVRVERAGVLLGSAPLTRPANDPLSWSSWRAEVPFDVRAGDRVAVRVLSGTFRDYHVWVVAHAPDS